MNITIGILIPFIGTTLGSALVYIMKNKIKNEVERFLLGFASGVMICVSIIDLVPESLRYLRINYNGTILIILT